MNSEIEDDNQEYKRYHKRDFKSDLTYEEAKNLVETLDEEVRIQAEYYHSQLLEDLKFDEDLGLVQAASILLCKNPRWNNVYMVKHNDHLSEAITRVDTSRLIANRFTLKMRKGSTEVLVVSGQLIKLFDDTIDDNDTCH